MWRTRLKTACLFVGLTLPLIALPACASASDVCPSGETLRSALTVTTPSRIEDLYEMPKDMDADGNVHIQVFEGSDLLTIPAQYEWVPKPANYIAPETITITYENDMSGGVRCYGRHERPVFYSDTVIEIGGIKRTSGAKFLGASIYKNTCHHPPKSAPVMTKETIPYDPAFWEDGDKLRVVLSHRKTVVRQSPPVTKTRKAKPVIVGKTRVPGVLTESAKTCRPALKPAPHLKMADVAVTSWSVVYLKGLEAELQKTQSAHRLISPAYDLSSAVLTTGIDPLSMDLVWHVFNAPCNPVGNQGLNARGEPKLDMSGNRVWTGAPVLQTACTGMFEDKVSGEPAERVYGAGLAENIFVNAIGPAKTYQIVDMSLGILIWYDKDGEEIARFQRIPQKNRP